MYGHGCIPEHDHTPDRGGRRRAGVAAWASQHDAGRIAKPLAETDGAAGAAAIRRDCDHHARGLGDGALKEEQTMVVLNRIYTRTGENGTTPLGSAEARRKTKLPL